MNNPSLASTLDLFPARRVLVVGDAILDHYLAGSVSRTSPEAPVPVLNVERETWLPGGAANVARNLAAQEAQAVLVGVCGRDDAARELIRGLEADPLITPRLVQDPSRPTTLKTRAMAQGQQMLRLDREDATSISEAVEQQVRAIVAEEMPRCDGVILSDYAKGLLTPALIRAIVADAQAAGREVIVDPKGRDYARYRGAALLTPNKKEAQDATGRVIKGEPSAIEAARDLQEIVAGEAICITLGGGGVGIFPRDGEPSFIPAQAREVFDVTGAGDTFISLLALARFSGLSFEQAARIGNAAAGIVVGRAGVATVRRNELRADLLGETGRRKRIGRGELKEACRSLALAGKRIVFTNGCFDLLNVCHIRLLEQARSLGDVLVVAINSDAGVRALKGPPRPLLNARERAELLAALPYVDFVVEFEDETPEALLRDIQPAILVKGSTTGEVVGRDIVESYGGEVRSLDLGFGPKVEDILARAAVSPAAANKGGLQ
ncbi:MAG: D-glycero-beta-D-manno-heptose-7-phosphate kinase [Sumerlaeia bacterium]